MPLQNRVTPDGSIIATPERGMMMGNRGGCLHTPQRTLSGRPWRTKAWIGCRLEFKGRNRRIMSLGSYTELFFLDEATALAAGHRPCFECRRAEAFRFAELWALAAGRSGLARATEIDRALHAQRLDEHGGKRTHRSQLYALPDGAFIRTLAGPALLWGDTLLPWSAAGYGAAEPYDPDDEADVLTPSGIIDVMKLGYTPMLHESARVSR